MCYLLTVTTFSDSRNILLSTKLTRDDKGSRFVSHKTYKTIAQITTFTRFKNEKRGKKVKSVITNGARNLK